MLYLIGNRLSKRQNEILTMVYDLYEMKIGEYIKDALIESLKVEITDVRFLLLSLMTTKRRIKARQTMSMFQISLMELVIIPL